MRWALTIAQPMVDALPFLGQRRAKHVIITLMVIGCCSTISPSVFLGIPRGDLSRPPLLAELIRVSFTRCLIMSLCFQSLSFLPEHLKAVPSISKQFPAVWLVPDPLQCTPLHARASLSLPRHHNMYVSVASLIMPIVVASACSVKTKEILSEPQRCRVSACPSLC